jgi:outer membrane protein assembly factor BamA
MNKTLIIGLLIILKCGIPDLYAQSDSITQQATKKNLRFSVLGGPGYTPDYGVVIGGSALFTFSTDPTDKFLKRSVMPFAFAYMFNGGGNITLKPELYFNHDKFRITGKATIMNSLDNYYGVGYETNSKRIRGEESTQYRNVTLSINPIFKFRIKTSDLFYGFSVDLSQRQMQSPSAGVQADSVYHSQGGTEDGLIYVNVGIGGKLSYDTRDVPANPYSGVFLELTGTYYLKVLGSDHGFEVYSLEYRHFKQLHFLGERKVLAWQMNGRFTNGNVPITELSMIGSPFDLRGYYFGQYRDKNAIFALAEYRHMFNAGDATFVRRMASKLGFTVWGGMGSVSKGIIDAHHILPNYGAGLRVELQPRMNFRVDFGQDPINKQTLVYFNMTEAF